MARPRKIKAQSRTLDARPDSLDFRDRMFVPTLVDVPPRRTLEDYRQHQAPILDQGTEGACTGFGLAAVVNYLLCTSRRAEPEGCSVSARMLYEMARRYDEWPGEGYDGSSARGAMKGWHKHGVCADEKWPYKAKKSDRELTPERANDASRRPLGAYFRVNHRDLVAMHCALAEVNILYATATVHAGWDEVGCDGRIPLRDEALGGHAFAIVAYNDEGFWIQNSWGDDWGYDGFAFMSYDDWLVNASDVWVARLGVPVFLRRPDTVAAANAKVATDTVGYTFHDLRPHVISLGNNGRFREFGTYGSSAASVRTILFDDFPKITEKWRKKRLLFYVHGGLTNEESAVQRLADYRQAMLDSEIYPLAFIWKTDFWTTLTNILRDALSRRRSEGILDATKDFMLDRLDDALEPLARMLGGKAQWDEMKENALLATTAAQGGARKTLELLAELLGQQPNIEVHVVGHSAGGVLHAPLVQYLASEGKIAQGPMKGVKGLGKKIATCTLWAPVCSVDLFKQTYLPLVENRGIERFALYTLTDQAERDDDCAKIYNKSLLYLVSHAFEAKPRIPLFRDGEPILGMQSFVAADTALKQLFKSPRASWVLAPNTAPSGSPDGSTSRRHGDFDDDQATLRSTLARALGSATRNEEFVMNHSRSAKKDQRYALDRLRH